MLEGFFSKIKKRAALLFGTLEYMIFLKIVGTMPPTQTMPLSRAQIYKKRNLISTCAIHGAMQFNQDVSR